MLAPICPPKQNFSSLRFETLTFGDQTIRFSVSRSYLLLTAEDEQQLKAEVLRLTDFFLNCGLPLYLETVANQQYKKATPERIRLWAQQALKADLSLCGSSLKLSFWSTLETFSGQVHWVAADDIRDAEILPWR